MSVNPVRSLIPAMLLLLFTAGIADPSSAATPVNPGDQAPDFTLTDLGGRPVSLSDYRGKVVLLNFWGTFCGPCRTEMPSLNNLDRDVKDRGFVVLAVSIDRSDKPVRSFIESVHSPFPLLLDTDKKVYYEKFATFALPLTYLINKRGMIVERYFGRQEWDSRDMQERIVQLTREE